MFCLPRNQKKNDVYARHKAGHDESGAGTVGIMGRIDAFARRAIKSIFQPPVIASRRRSNPERSVWMLGEDG
jgi:hypothetical protein